MTKDIGVYIEDIIESIQKIKEYTSHLTEEEFDDSDSCRDAVLMRLVVIGESAHKIPTDVQEKFNAIPWRKIINLRNIIVHDYISINGKRIWSIIQSELPEFQKQMEELLKDFKPV